MRPRLLAVPERKTWIMNPGRDLDALIAEKVLGWQEVNKNHQWNYRTGRHCYGWPDDYYGALPGQPTDVFNADWRLVPKFSTDIADAWKVVKQLRLWLLPLNDRWMACQELGPVFFDEDVGVVEGHVTHIGIAETEAHAICIAALEVVGISV